MTYARGKGLPYDQIPPHSYAAFVGEDFGELVVDELELLQMADLGRPYPCLAKCSFANK